MKSVLELRKFTPNAATDSEFSAINAFNNALHAEVWPEDASKPLSHTIRSIRGLQQLNDLRVHTFFLWAGARICAEAEVHVPLREDNRHLAFAGIEVLPDYRRQGLAKRLLPHVADTTSAEGRRLIGFGTSEAVPAGETLAEQLGAKRGMKTHTNQLSVEALEPTLLEGWQNGAPKDTFELGFWDGPYPEEELDAIVELIQVMNTAPRDDLEMEDFKLTPALVRDYERYHAEIGTSRWVAYTREKQTGTLAGYTETFWHPNNPRVLHQGDTGVEPTYRGHGLGKWLKAAMLQRVLSAKPEIAYVRTGNADSNVPMLKINHALGFKPRLAEVWWELPLDKLRSYLDGLER
jgi:mycothiol synthase